ncbi:MAG: S41 family peptidase [Gammaproteobacteria bacterium]|nr:S41 family peptidase [Gammaproteobacteria bacterium]MCB1878684.1 S41 family peptidase [Gammaproteobacteria bacterium]MCB1904958.1 S41 family peptidase [Gammaproteobacteria bacterium]
MKHCMGLVFGFSLVIILGGALQPGLGVAEEKATVPMQDLRAFAEIFGRIKQDYVEPVADRELLEHAIRGMLTGLDPHSAYLNADEYRSLQVGTTGEFGGLGIEVGLEDGFVKVIAPIDDTPAQRAGVQAGDLIIKLDDRPIKGVSLDEAVKLMRGKRGTSITLTIVRESEKNPITITVVRDVIRVASVKSRILEEGFGYLRISHFQSRSTQDMLQHLSELKNQSGGQLRGLVLDLRNNPGGILNGAVAVSDAFLTDGIIVYTQGRDATSRLDFTAAPDDVLEGSPIVVLVNGGSASASEIVAGALQDHKRAVIMGTRTFGKGSVQTIVPVNGHAAVKLTTARYFTPSGRSIQAEGIIPDIKLSDIKVTSVKGPDLAQVKESDLKGHLENGNMEKDAKEKEKKSSEAEVTLSETDYQLGEALNLLKALYILEKKG